MKLSIFSDGSEPVPFVSPASNVVCSVSPGGKESSPCQRQGQRYHLLIHAALPPSYFQTFPPPSCVRFQLANVHFLRVHDEVLVSFSLCLQTVAQRQIQADSILKKLQYWILNSNYSDVYSNQCHNRWRGMNLWQAGRSFSSWSCGFWCLMTASREELTHLSVAHIKKFLSAAERERELNVRNKLALMHTSILLMYNLCLRACIYARNRTL